jgi:hypothetical protein
MTNSKDRPKERVINGTTWVYDYTFADTGGTFRVDKRMYDLSKDMQQRNRRRYLEMDMLEDKSSYKAIITKIKTSKHPNADRLQLGMCDKIMVVVGLDVKDGELGILFPPDGQLSKEYATANDLVGRTVNGKREGGYFAKNRRVRAQTLRGAKSQGYWAPLSSLAFTNAAFSSFKEGDTFSTYGGTPICNKYFTPATLKSMNSRSSKLSYNVEFPKHFDTNQLDRCYKDIPKPSNIVVTEKEHGTSGRTGKLLMTTEYKKTIRETIGDFITTGIWTRSGQREEWKVVTGTRNVVLAEETNGGFYGCDDFRTGVLPGGLGYLLRKGEIIYYEIVGYANEDRPIMPSVGTLSLKSKSIKQAYGSTMTFKYGCAPGECKLHVYRIANINPDGFLIDLPWLQVVGRCKELGLTPVHTILSMSYNTKFEFDNTDHSKFYESHSGLIRTILDKFDSTAHSHWDASHIMEGIVVRVEHENGVYFLKHKSHEFYVLEGIIKENEDYVDIEEIS